MGLALAERPHSAADPLPTLEQCRGPLLRLVRDACKRGSFVLSSGKKSDFYVDGKQVTLEPSGSFWLSVWVLRMLEGSRVDAIGGREIGAIPISTAVQALARQRSIYLNTFVVRKSPKPHGLGNRLEGPDLKEKHVAIVDDVVTEGGSILDAIKAVEEAGGRVVKVLALVDRQEGGGERIASKYDFTPLFTKKELIGP